MDSKQISTMILVSLSCLLLGIKEEIGVLGPDKK